MVAYFYVCIRSLHLVQNEKYYFISSSLFCIKPSLNADESVRKTNFW